MADTKKTLYNQTRILPQVKGKNSKSTDANNGVPSGFTAIDRMTHGWQPSDLIVIAARPSMGKTAFALSMVRNMAILHEQVVAVFSIEMSAVQLMMRLMTAETGLSYADLRSRRLSSEQWCYFKSAASLLLNTPIFIDDTPALSVLEFCSKARRLKMLYDVKVIIVDYLQLMTGGPDMKNGNREQEMEFILRTLKATAKELNVPIILLTQVSRHATTKRPQLTPDYGSAAIEQHADVIAFIHRPEYYGIDHDENGMPTDGMAEFIIAKHRNGAVCDVRLRFLKDRAKFVDTDFPSTSIPEQPACDKASDCSKNCQTDEESLDDVR